jgi:hypothetical protein
MTPSHPTALQGNLPGPAKPVPGIVKQPVHNPITYQVENDFQYGEFLAASVPQRDIIALQIPRSLPKRKLYLWLSVTTLLTDYSVTGDVSFYLTGQKMGSLPVAVALSKTGGGSLVAVTAPSMFSTAGGASTENTITIFPANPSGAGIQVVNLQPLSLRATADEIRLSLTNFTAGTIAVRAWLGCMSVGRSKQQNK